MALSNLWTQAQLEIACGGAASLVRLAKAPNASSAVYTDFIAEVRKASQGIVYAIVQVAFDPTDSTVPGADLLQQHCLAVGVYWAYHKGTGGHAIPDDVRRAYDDALAILRELKKGELALGTEDEPTGNHGAETVTVRDSTRALRSNMRGFC